MFNPSRAFRLYITLYATFAVVLLNACGVVAFYDGRVNEKVREGNEFLRRGTIVSREWSNEFVTVFTPQNRAGFPANREFFRPHAENQIRLLEQLIALNNNAAEKFDQAARISHLAKEKKCITIMAASFRKETETYLLMLEQIRLVLDENVNDRITFNTRFAETGDRVGILARERDELQSAGKQCAAEKPQLSIPY